MSTTDDPSPKAAIGRTALGPLEWMLSLFAALTLFALMALRCVDVVGRYAFNAPVPGTSELTGLGLALIIFAALPIVTAHGEHVSVGLLELVGGRFRGLSRWVERVTLLITSLAALSLMAWRLWDKARSLASYGDFTSYLNVPVAPFAYFMSVMSWLAVAVVAFQVAALFHSPPDNP